MVLAISKEMSLILTIPEAGKSEVKVPAGLVLVRAALDASESVP